MNTARDLPNFVTQASGTAPSAAEPSLVIPWDRPDDESLFGVIVRRPDEDPEVLGFGPLYRWEAERTATKLRQANPRPEPIPPGDPEWDLTPESTLPAYTIEVVNREQAAELGITFVDLTTLTVDNLAEKMRTEMPNGWPDLWELIHALPNRADSDAAKLWDAAARELEHDDAMTQAATALAEQMQAALTAVSNAQNELRRLTTGDAWHVEYAEGAAGFDIGKFLEDSRLGLVAAIALNRGVPA